MFCIPHFVFNCCTFRWVEGKGTRQSTSILFVLVMYLFHYLCKPTCIKVMFLLLYSRCGVGPMHHMDSLRQSPPTMELRRSINHRRASTSHFLARSFSSMLETIVCEFVPEQLLSYSRLHFIYSSKARLTIQLFQHS